MINAPKTDRLKATKMDLVCIRNDWRVETSTVHVCIQKVFVEENGSTPPN